MQSLKRAGEEGSATPPSDPSCPVPNTRGLPHRQGGETIAGFEDPSSRAIIPLLGQRPAVAHLPSGAERSKVCKSFALRTAKEAVSRAKGLMNLHANGIRRSVWACVATTRWSGVGQRTCMGRLVSRLILDHSISLFDAPATIFSSRPAVLGRWAQGRSRVAKGHREATCP